MRDVNGHRLPCGHVDRTRQLRAAGEVTRTSTEIVRGGIHRNGKRFHPDPLDGSISGETDGGGGA